MFSYHTKYASSRSRHASTKRNSSDSDGLLEPVKERLLHMELENCFLEERVKVLEEGGRKYQLRIDELRAELRETTKQQDVYKNQVIEYSEDFRKQLEVTEGLAKIRSLIDEKRSFADNWLRTSNLSDKSIRSILFFTSIDKLAARRKSKQKKYQFSLR
ncbi:hypothetical protein R1sor_025404 [Riccia sorocarpa]|uniref:Uncharacterized protein n=1 Tax=Riccia sorocarpa TaxID=122646 RepID=A0ABD3G9W1_9MARC